ncbi:MAG: CotH kinase family protein [Candidatus Marinimicrobia bacterium]|nr:CotH kinase family protein [Candidatus Neomarinimicrobiota bacterium]MBL7010538.1 CotH kinase family protein [Candidatus Neomarinimicrobiota bacterium]MBL7030458.1 CotH kinase family protein [Candidatus Neomarinimicrobiota bacterium]
MIKKVIQAYIMIVLFFGCEDKKQEEIEDPNFDTPDWTTATHGKSADPNYDVVFPSNKVNRMDIVISEKNWQKMLDDMTDKYGPFGSGNMGPDGKFVDENPIWVPCDFYFEDKQWYKVGVRFKGNSTIKFAWSRGKWKIPLKLDFDEFEDEYPQIDNQRFYGFKKISMSSNAMDNSLLREKVAADIFREVGIPAAHTAFYVIYLDHGDGAQFWGLYTAVEVVDDTVIETQFINDKGNLYKPEGRGATFDKDSFNQESFEKKTNEDDSDWKDIISMFEALHSDNRLTNPESWRGELENTFRADIFLKWLATNTAIQNWDSYGKMSQNYYLYNDPATGLLTWITWDHNEALDRGKAGGALSISLKEVREDWPLIRFLMDDEVYQKEYKTNLQIVLNGPFSIEKMVDTYRTFHGMIRPFVEGTNDANIDPEISPQQLDEGLNYLINHVQNRHNVVNEYLSK